MALGPEETIWYIVFVNGEVEFTGHDKAEALNLARMAVDQKISDYHRHRLPIQVDLGMAYELDVYVYELRNDSRIKLPIQKWFDDYYAETKADENDREEREWKHYLDLKEKFKDRPIE